MAPASGRFLRGNAFLVTAFLLPVAVVGLFLLASAIPRWRVPAPAFDLILQARRYPGASRPTVAVEFKVRDGRVEATVRPLMAEDFAQLTVLFLFDHGTMDVRAVPFDPPELSRSDPPVTLPVEALAGRRVLDGPKAPDGYELRIPNGRGPGLVGDLFGMARAERRPSIVNGGRVILLDLQPARSRDYYDVSALGWAVDGRE